MTMLYQVTNKITGPPSTHYPPANPTHYTAVQQCSSTYGSKPVPTKNRVNSTARNNQPIYETMHQPARHHPVHPPPTHYPPSNPLQHYSSAAIRSAVYRYARSIWLVLEYLGPGKKRGENFFTTPRHLGGQASRHPSSTYHPPTDLRTPAVQQQCSSTYRPIYNGSKKVQQYVPQQYTYCARSWVRISAFLRLSAFPGRERAVPRRVFSRHLIVKLRTAGRYVAGDTEGWCVRRAWHGRAVAGGRVANGIASYAKRILKPNSRSK